MVNSQDVNITAAFYESTLKNEKTIQEAKTMYITQYVKMMCDVKWSYCYHLKFIFPINSKS